MSDRAEFEKWFRANVDDYDDIGSDTLFECWQAARSQSPNHIAEARNMVKGDVSTAGSVILLEGKTYERAIVVAFESDDDLRAAIAAGQCRFTVFGGEV